MNKYEKMRFDSNGWKKVRNDSPTRHDAFWTSEVQGTPQYVLKLISNVYKMSYVV